MSELRYVLGIDSSTQGTTGLIIDRDTFETVAEAKIRYRDDPRLSGFGLLDGAPILPPREEGEADQPALLLIAAIDAVLADLPRDALAKVAAVNFSAQQHGQVWLGPSAGAAIAGLRLPGSGAAEAPGLAARLGPALASDRAPIWMSSNTAREATELRAAAGGSDAMTELSGSDSPLRFSGAVLRHKALFEPGVYQDCARIHLISSFLAALFSGQEDAPIDWGNGSGMSLMDWRGRSWSETLLAAASRGLPDGAEGLARRLPALAHPLALTGCVAAYFSERYGLPPSAAVLAGSGDNPQTKVLANGALLSLGTSFVIMTEGENPHRSANAMYDGLGRPFLFGCRTNGSLCWESIRKSHGLAPDDFAASEKALETVTPGSVLRLLQNEHESFPESDAIDSFPREAFAEDYAGAVDSTLGLLYQGSARFASSVTEVAVTGGAAASEGTRRRIAAIWNCPVVPIGETGAAAGAAVAAAVAISEDGDAEHYAGRAAAAVSRRGRVQRPEPSLVVAYHGANGYLARLAALFETVKDRSSQDLR
ncbi:MAG TPA: xylulose kinase [bacterium]|nr:xylulose kinase [bacterium]